MGTQVLLTWQSMAALTLSVGWLVPLHYPPWTSFHSDAWITSLLLVLCWVTLAKRRSVQPWPYIAFFIAILCVVPLIQLAFGQIKLAGTAWLSSLYLLGLLLAILNGARWQADKSCELADILFMAFGIAACVSVGIQVCQWLNVTDGCLCAGSWVLPQSDNHRIAANLAQPNQTATLLLLGVMAFAWAWLRKTISGYSCVFVIAFLLFGVALTDSRTAALSLLIVLVCIVYWRRFWPSRLVPYAAVSLFLFFVAMVMLQGFLAHLLLIENTSNLVERSQGETRWALWSTFGKAALQRPWFGYGWDQTGLALVLTLASQKDAFDTPPLLTAYAHNLFIDLIIWLGIPLGLLVSTAIVGWLGRAVKHVKDGKDALLVFGIIALGVHAMLELPLYYAYFLLPLGLMIGMLEARMSTGYALTSSLRPVVCIALVCSVSFIAIVRDYFVIEQSYSLLRLDTARIENKIPYQAPKVWALTQLRDYIALARLQAAPNMSQQSIEWVTNVTMLYPARHNLVKLATVLALNGQPLQAAHWLQTLCSLYGASECTRGQAEWTRLQNQFPQLVAVQWPE